MTPAAIAKTATAGKCGCAGETFCAASGLSWYVGPRKVTVEDSLRFERRV
jgi:hypothetical protein